MFPRTTAADQFVDWLVTTSGVALQVVELALQLGLVLGQLVDLLLALGWALPLAQAEAEVEGQPLKPVEAGVQEDLSLDSHSS